MSALRQVVASAVTPFVLVLDDVHELGSIAASDLVGAISRSLPEESQLVLCGRRELVDVISPARAARRVLEIAAEDLALSIDEARALVSAVDARGSSEIAEEFVQHTEGWAAGLYLLALAQREGGAIEIGGADADRFVEDYLWTQHLATLPAEQLAFLVRSSVLDQMSGELCDVALDRKGSSRMLDEIERSNLFLVPLDHERTWYRYHELFRSVLSTRTGSHRPECGCGGAAQGVGLVCRTRPAGERDGLRRLRRRHGPDGPADRDVRVQALSQREAEDHRRLAGTLPGRCRARTSIPTWLCLAPLPMRTSEVRSRRSGGSTRQHDAADSAPPPADGSASLHAWVLTGSAFLCREGPGRMREDADQALAELGASSPLRPLAMWFRATALFLQGDDAAEAALEEALDATSSTGANVRGYRRVDPSSPCSRSSAVTSQGLGTWSRGSMTTPGTRRSWTTPCSPCRSRSKHGSAWRPVIGTRLSGCSRRCSVSVPA